MGYNSRYFVNKDERVKQAKEHTEKMERLYKKEIKRSIVNSKIYDGYPAYEPLTISVVGVGPSTGFATISVPRLVFSAVQL